MSSHFEIAQTKFKIHTTYSIHMNKETTIEIIRDDQTENVSGGKQMASLKIVRDSGYVDLVRFYEIVLDGKRVGKIWPGDTTELSVSPGQHSLLLRIDWCGSETIPFTVEEGSSILFEVKNNFRGVRLLLGFWYLTFAHNSYLRLTRVA
jgi:hypothetical protein